MVHKLATGMTTILNKTTRTANSVKGKFYYKYYNTSGMFPLFYLIDTCKGLVGWSKKSNLQSK